MKPPVSRAGRLLDAAALVLFLAGAGFFARAWTGLQQLQTFQPAADAAPFAALARAEQWSNLSRVGVGLMVAGVAVAVASAIMARRLAGRPRGP